MDYTTSETAGAIMDEGEVDSLDYWNDNRWNVSDENRTGSSLNVSLLHENRTNNLLFITETQEKLLGFLGVFSVLVCVIGILCNSLSIHILRRKQLRGTTSTFLIALSVTDMVVLVTLTSLCSFGSMVSWNRGVIVDVMFLPKIYPLLRPVALMSICTSVWLTVALTVDRYLAVCHAMKTKHLCTIWRARVVICAIVLIAIIHNIPACLEYTVTTKYSPLLNKTQYFYDLTDLGANVVYRQVYHSWILVPFVWGIPFISLVYMNVCLGLAVHQSRRKSKELGYPLTRGLDTTAMLVAVVVSFLLFQSPHMVASVIWTVHPTLYQDVSYLIFYYVAVIFLLINSSANFFVYTVFGKRFRHQLMELVCSCRFSRVINNRLDSPYRRRRKSSFFDTSFIEYRKKSTTTPLTGDAIDTVVFDKRDRVKSDGLFTCIPCCKFSERNSSVLGEKRKKLLVTETMTHV